MDVKTQDKLGEKTEIYTLYCGELKNSPTTSMYLPAIHSTTSPPSYYMWKEYAFD
jgi:hypothetical protein